jgi:arylsulfatase
LVGDWRPPRRVRAGGGCATEPRAGTGAGQKPNIVVIWGDDICITDVSAYSNGLMGFRTPNIGRVAHEGTIFTDYYGEQSCTAGRAACNDGALGTFSWRQG